ncbi:uncharacterized protein RCH25_043718 [Pelodytes ibericus]
MRPSYGVPKFLTKIWSLVEDPRTNDYIRWSQDGRSFIVVDEENFARELLPKYFKHNNMASFVRQLNWYGFHKVVHDEFGAIKQEKNCSGKYQHDFFQRGQEQLLTNIKRKVPVPRVDDGGGKSAPDDMQKLLTFLHQLQGRQDVIDSTVESLKRENEALWKEVLQLRKNQYRPEAQFDSVSPYQSHDGMPPNKTLMIDNTGNYNELTVPKASQHIDQDYENRSPWEVNGKASRGTKRAFHRGEDNLATSLGESSSPLTTITLPQAFESYQSDSDSSMDSCLSDSEEMGTEDTCHDLNHSMTKVPGNVDTSHRGQVHNKLESDTEHQDSVTEFKINYDGSGNTDEYKSGCIESGHAKKRRKTGRSSSFKMEQMLKEMHKDNTCLTKRVLTLEQQSFEKLSEISTVLSTLANYIMNTEHLPKSLFSPSQMIQQVDTQTSQSQHFGVWSKMETPVKGQYES